MTKIREINKPKILKKPVKSPLTAIERWIWWKKQYLMTFSIVISLLIVPIFAWRRGNIILGIRISILFYLAIMGIFFLIQRTTSRKDEEFLKSQGYNTEKPKKWWHIPLKMFFLLLRIYILYLLYEVWMMTLG